MSVNTGLRPGLCYAVALLAWLPVLASPLLAAPQNNGVGSQFELLYWQSVAASDDPGQLEAYLAQYPNGTFAALARAKIAMLTKRTFPPSAPPSSSVAPTVAPPPITPQPAEPQPAAMPDPVAIVMGTAVAPVPVGQSNVALPPRARFQQLPPVVLPSQFCTAMDRNAFYDAVYRPSKDVADQNNQTAITHMRALQSLYDGLGQHGDMASQNVVSAEARAYQPVAAGAYRASLAYDGLFNRLMAVPIITCTGAPPQ